MTCGVGFGSDVVEKAIAKTGFSGYKLCRAENGVSTEVYRMEKDSQVLYLRVGHEGLSLWPEAEAHRRCREKGVPVPEIVYYEEDNPTVERSIMITTEIKGLPVKGRENSPEIFREAGRNLARLNSVSIEGIGWIKNDPGVREFMARGLDYNDFILDDMDKKMAKLIDLGIFDSSVAKRTIKYVQEKAGILLEYRGQGNLAHGDFDLNHIFADKGKFSGIIDLGDVRSTSLFHDLAHFYTYAREHFSDLVTGYQEITQLGVDHEERIKTEAVVLAIGKLWWVGENRINKLTQKRADYKMIRELVG